MRYSIGRRRRLSRRIKSGRDTPALEAIGDLPPPRSPHDLRRRQNIMERTDSIPLFVEEITKAVLEAENNLHL
jgi:hypothetical protein